MEMGGNLEKNRFTTNPEPSLGKFEILCSFWMEEVTASYAILAILLSLVSFRLDWIIMNRHLQCSEWSFPI